MKTSFSVCLLLLVSTHCALAWTRGSVTDKEAVSRAQVIVIGHLKKESLQLRATPIVSMSDSSAEAVLVVSEVLKGPFEVKELPIKIVYGLTAVVGDDDKKEGPGALQSPAAGEIKIYDSGNSAISFEPVTGDLNQDQIWLLRIEFGDDDDRRLSKPSKTLRVWDPEDIQPMSKKDALIALVEDKASHKAERKKEAEQGGTGQPATRPDLKSEDSDKPQP